MTQPTRPTAPHSDLAPGDDAGGRAGPLHGMLVVDLTRVLAGPFCTMVLSDLGARVIKVERPGSGDDARSIGPFLQGQSAYFASVNRGKESIALDLQEPSDRARLERLLQRADVLVENFRPGAMARLGYAWEDLADRYPSLVYASISGFGQTGPMSGQAAYDAVVQALGGIMSVTGPAGGEPTRVGTSIADLGGGLFGAVGILAALVERAATGRGRRVDVAMLDGQVALLENALARLGATGVAPGPGGGHHPSIAPFGTFAAADGQIVLAAGNDELFRRCCAALGAPALAADDRFLTNVERCLHRDELVAALEAILAGSGVERWLADLEAAGVPCAAVRDVGQLATDPQVAARRMLVKLEGPPGHPLSGLTVAGNPVKLSGVHDPATRPLPPALDQHRDAILAELEAAEEGATGA